MAPWKIVTKVRRGIVVTLPGRRMPSVRPSKASTGAPTASCSVCKYKRETQPKADGQTQLASDHQSSPSKQLGLRLTCSGHAAQHRSMQSSI